MRDFTGYKRGVNLGGWLSQCVSREKEHFETFITEEDIRTIAGWGLDHVRLPLDYDIVMSDDGTFLEAGFTYVDKCIEWCQNQGLNLILDLHKTKGYMFDEAEVANPDLFFTDKSLQEDFKVLWKELATRYGKYKDTVALELLNEIVNPDYTAEWNRIATETIKIIREIAPQAYLIIGGTCNNSVKCVSSIDIPMDERTVLTFHCYEPMAFTHQKAGWVEGMTPDFDVDYPMDIASLREKSNQISKKQVGFIYDSVLDHADGKLFDVLFEDAVRFTREKDVMLYCGEYGVIDQTCLSGCLNWYQDIHNAFERYQIGRACWNYKHKDFGITDEHYAPILSELLKAL